jgi:hypothetical protein
VKADADAFVITPEYQSVDVEAIQKAL